MLNLRVDKKLFAEKRDEYAVIADGSGAAHQALFQIRTDEHDTVGYEALKGYRATLPTSRWLFGASIEHAIELAIVDEADRFVAIELLRDPSGDVDPEADPEADSVELWIAQGVDLCGNTNEIVLLSSREYGIAGLGKMDQQNSFTWRVREFKDDITQEETKLYAGREQAVTAIIKRAAPWIASALAIQIRNLGSP